MKFATGLACAALTVVCVSCSSCSSSSAATVASSDASAPVLGDFDPRPFGGGRPVNLYVPSGYRETAPLPLVIMLHGYAVVGGLEEALLRLEPLAEERGFLYAYPNGTVDSAGNRFWSATDACCNIDGSLVDDSTYLASLVVEIGKRYRVDPKRVYFVGHSNGGFMAYRMACDHAGVIAAVVSLAGATWNDTSKCAPSEPVAVLQVHGTKDTEVLYDGLQGAGAYPGAKATVLDWATYDGCALTPDTTAPPIDIEDSLPGAETSITRYASGCRAGGHAELWTMEGGGHIPNLNLAFSTGRRRLPLRARQALSALGYAWLAAPSTAAPAPCMLRARHGDESDESDDRQHERREHGQEETREAQERRADSCPFGSRRDARCATRGVRSAHATAGEGARGAHS